MNGLWTHQRRFCGFIRYRHGGFNAVRPINSHTVGAQARLRADALAQAVIAPPLQEPRGAVVNFAERRQRAALRHNTASRAAKAAPTPRPSGRPQSDAL